MVAKSKKQAAPYPRDLIGYGRNPPHPHWPGEARVAVQFVLNYEEGAENNVLHGDKGSESLPVGDHRRGVVSGAAHEHGVDLRVRLAGRRVADPAGVRAAEAAADGVRGVDGSGAEPRADGGVRGARARDRVSRVAVDSLSELRAEARGRAHAGRDRDHQADDRGEVAARVVHGAGQSEYAAAGGGARRVRVRLGLLRGRSAVLDEVETSKGKKVRHLVVPYTLDANDMRFATPQGFNTAEQFFTYLRDAFDVLYAEGADAPKMMSVGMHCRLLGRPGRMRGLQRFLDHVQAHDKVWVTRRIDVARHWRGRFPGEG